MNHFRILKSKKLNFVCNFDQKDCVETFYNYLMLQFLSGALFLSLFRRQLRKNQF